MPASKIFDPTSQVTLATDTITITGHDLLPYQGVLYGNGGNTSIGGLVDGYKYYIIYVDTNNFKLAISEQDARDSIAVDLLSLGTGTTHSFTTTNIFPQNAAYHDFFRTIRMTGGGLVSPGAKFEADSVRDTFTIVGGAGLIFSDVNEDQKTVTLNAGEYNFEVPVGTTNLRLYNEIDGVTTDSQEIEFSVDRGINITRISDTEIRFEGLGVTETDTLHSVTQRGNITSNTLYMNNLVVGKIQSIPGEDGVTTVSSTGTTGNPINLTGDGTLDSPLEIDLFYSSEPSKTVQVNFSTPASGTMSYSASYKAESALSTGSVILQREDPLSPGTWVTIDSATGTTERFAYTVQNIYAEPNVGVTNFRIITSWTGLTTGYVDFPINIQFEITPIAVNEMIVSDTANKILNLGLLDGTINFRGNINVFDQMSTDGLTIFNNNIQTLNSNDNLVLDPSGTGALELRSQTLLTDQTTFNLINTTATTVNFAGAATTLEIGAATGDTNVNNNLIVDLDLQVRGGDITTNQTSFNLLNATAATINFAGAATTLEVGAATGTTNVNNNLVVDLDLEVKGGDITTDQTTFNLLNTTATTVNAFGAATTLEIGAATGTTNVNNNLVVDLDLQVKGGDITTDQTTFNLLNTTATTVNAFGAATTINLGSLVITGNTIDTSDSSGITVTPSVTFESDISANDVTVNQDLVVQGNLTVNGTTVTLNTTTLDVEDLNITVAKGAINGTAANGAGITVEGADATLTYASADDSWNFNKIVKAPGFTGNVTGDVSGNAGTVTNGVYTTGSYADPTWITSLSASKVGLGNVTNESKATMFTAPTFTGTTTLQQSTEVLNTKTGATGTVVHDFSTGSIWYHSSISSNFTANFTNVPTTNDRTISIALILVQGATPYIPSAVQIDGTPVTLNWLGTGAPSGAANKVDLVGITLIRTGSSWTVLGALTTYG